MRIYSWNVNGLRSCHRKGAFIPFVEGHRPDVLCLQEVRALPEQLADEVRQPVLDGEPMHATWHPAEKKGYSGVATLSRAQPDEVIIGLGEPRFDTEGRLLTTRFGNLVVINGYFPHGKRNHERLPYKTDFYRALYAFANTQRDAGRQVVITGDWNTAHHDIDIKNHKSNRKTSGFTQPERDLVTEFADAGWIDAFRRLHPTDEVYSWWSQRAGVRARNVGWRIDMHWVDPSLWPKVTGAPIHTDVMGSDHCPIALHLS